MSSSPHALADSTPRIYPRHGRYHGVGGGVTKVSKKPVSALTNRALWSLGGRIRIDDLSAPAAAVAPIGSGRRAEPSSPSPVAPASAARVPGALLALRLEADIAPDSTYAWSRGDLDATLARSRRRRI